MTSRWWMGTINNPEYINEDFFDLLVKGWGADYTIGQFEKVTTPHIQVCMWFKEKVRNSRLNKVIFGHYEIVRNPEKAVEYC